MLKHLNQLDDLSIWGAHLISLSSCGQLTHSIKGVWVWLLGAWFGQWSLVIDQWSCPWQCFQYSFVMRFCSLTYYFSFTHKFIYVYTIKLKLSTFCTPVSHHVNCMFSFLSFWHTGASYGCKQGEVWRKCFSEAASWRRVTWPSGVSAVSRHYYVTAFSPYF